MVVEVKSLFNKNEVIEHQERMKIVREQADKRSDKRKYLAFCRLALSSGWTVFLSNNSTILPLTML